MKLFLIVAIPAFLLSTSLVGAPSPEGSGPRPGTVEALQCLVRQGPPTCANLFQGGARMIAKNWVYPDAKRDFERGALVSSKFRRRASEANSCDYRAMIGKPTREMDIFDIRFAHVGYTFYISPADAQGNIDALAVSPFPHDLQLCDR